MSEETGLVVIPEGGALEIFTAGGLSPILAKIETDARKHVPDLSTDKSRKAIASNARMVSNHKVFIENARKVLVSDMVKQKKDIDSEGKRCIDFCDALRDELRKPLTDWEEEQKRKEAEKVAAAEREKLHAEAVQENELFTLRAEKAAMEAEQERIRVEAERVAEESRLEAERVANDQRIAEEATLEAERVAAQKIADAEAQRKQAELDRIAAEQREKLAAEMAEDRRIAAEHQVETDRIAAENKAEQDRLDAIQRTNNEAEQRAQAVEQARVVKLAAEKADADKKAANKAHQRKVNQIALKDFTNNGLTEDTAKSVIELIAKGKIEHVTINY